MGIIKGHSFPGGFGFTGSAPAAKDGLVHKITADTKPSLTRSEWEAMHKERWGNIRKMQTDFPLHKEMGNTGFERDSEDTEREKELLKGLSHGGAMKTSKSYKKGGAAKSKKLRAIREEDANKMLREIAASEASQVAPDQAVMRAMPPIRKQYPTNRSEPLIPAAPMPGAAGMLGMGGMSKGGMAGKQQAKIGTVMKEFKGGTLHSGSKDGPPVKNSKQAIAIAMSEARNMSKRKA